MECHGCRTRGERAALWPRRSRSWQRQATATAANGTQTQSRSLWRRVAATATATPTRRLSRAHTPTVTATGDWLQLSALRSFVRRIRSCARSLVCSLPSCRSFVYLTRSRALGLATLSPSSTPTLLACAIVTPPLAPCESHTLSLPTLSGLRSARLGVRLFVCSAALSRCPLLASVLCSASFISIFRVYR